MCSATWPLIGFFIFTVAGFGFGVYVSSAIWRDQLILRGYLRHNLTTGKWQWLHIETKEKQNAQPE
jgi:hypothetical protein